MHWGFRSWILGVRSVPSHWRQDGEGVGGAHEGLRRPPSQLGPPDLPAARPAHHHSDVLGQVLGAAHQEVGEGCLWEAEASVSGDWDPPSPLPGRHGGQGAQEEGAAGLADARLTPA